jgi:hypothetical protein
MSTPRRRRTPSPRLQFVISILALATVALTTACGSGSMSTPSSLALSGNTQVTLVLSGTANDQLTEFELGIEGISLTSQSGKMVSVLSALQVTEFIHINSGIEPLVTSTSPRTSTGRQLLRSPALSLPAWTLLPQTLSTQARLRTAKHLPRISP